MKIAVSGKGGVGKTTISALIIKAFALKGKKVFAIDADPDTNLAQTLGFPDPSKIIPLIKMKELIEERTGSKTGAPLFKLNPKVDDIPDKYFYLHENVKLAVMGTVRGGGLGCTCSENAFLKALIRHLILEREEVVILDMEAGIEHLGRGTIEAINRLLIIVEPGEKSIDTAIRIKKLAGEIGLKNISIIANKVRNASDENFIRKKLQGLEILAFIPYSEKIVDADLKNIPPFENNRQILGSAESIIEKIKI